MTAKEYIQELGIEYETIYDNAERMHSLECLLDDYHQAQLKLLGLHGVVVSEAELCQCKQPQDKPVGEFLICQKCNKPL